MRIRHPGCFAVSSLLVPRVSTLALPARPDYGRAAVRIEFAHGSAVIGDAYVLHASHAIVVQGEELVCTVPPGEAGWAVLGPIGFARPYATELAHWRTATLEHWRGIATRTAGYSGPYERQVRDSLRAIRLLCHEETGGVVAAATTSLPEVPGGERNWDYRYVWLRDTGMIVSALARMGRSVREGEAYLDFICRSRGSSARYPLAVFTTLDGEPAPAEAELALAGYMGSRPVRVGNGAREQLQLDAFANVLLGAKLVYARSNARIHCEMVEAIADFLSAHWQEPDHGIWEESVRRQYTASKVIVACALDSIAEYSRDSTQADHWRAATREIRAYVARHCLTSGGAYAAVAGGKAVDVSAALFPIWAYTAADTPEMVATVAALERDYRFGDALFRRHLECADAREEGAFLAGSLWVAQYWVMRNELHRARGIIDAVLACGNDLGLFAEEGDPEWGLLLGNFPQAFVHAALVGAVVDLKGATL